jgi:P27 family predicted phage terminase small subunit
MKKENGPLTTAPKPPAHLPEDARQTWRDTCAYLLDRQLLHAGDLRTIEAFASAAARLRTLETILNEQGPLTADGKAHPGVSAANGTAAAVAKLAGALGLAPVSRARLSAANRTGGKPPEGAKQWATVLQGGKR